MRDSDTTCTVAPPQNNQKKNSPIVATTPMSASFATPFSTPVVAEIKNSAVTVMTMITAIRLLLGVPSR